MNEQRLDHLTRGLTQVIDRRAGVRGLLVLGGVLGGVLGSTDGALVSGKCKPTCGECQLCARGACRKGKRCKKGACQPKDNGTRCATGTCQDGVCAADTRVTLCIESGQTGCTEDTDCSAEFAVCTAGTCTLT